MPSHLPAPRAASLLALILAGSQWLTGCVTNDYHRADGYYVGEPAPRVHGGYGVYDGPDVFYDSGFYGWGYADPFYYGHGYREHRRRVIVHDRRRHRRHGHTHGAPPRHHGHHHDAHRHHGHHARPAVPPHRSHHGWRAPPRPRHAPPPGHAPPPHHHGGHVPPSHHEDTSHRHHRSRHD